MADLKLILPLIGRILQVDHTPSLDTQSKRRNKWERQKYRKKESECMQPGRHDGLNVTPWYLPGSAWKSWEGVGVVGSWTESDLHTSLWIKHDRLEVYHDNTTASINGHTHAYIFLHCFQQHIQMKMRGTARVRNTTICKVRRHSSSCTVARSALKYEWTEASTFDA